MSDERDNLAPSAARSAAIDILRALVEAGFTAYFAGGCVRDRLLGIDPKDYDIATDARPEQIQQLFPNAHGVGEAFGVMLVRQRGHTTEVATFRTDGVYSDHRRPDEVAFSDAEHDAQRRDFTINGLFEDPLAEKIIDHVGGQDDLAARIIRAIGDPAARLAEDQLRRLRAVRFAARFGFTIERETADAIREDAERLEGVSRERIGQEIRLMLSDASRAVAAWELQYLGIDGEVLQEPAQVVAPCRLARLPDHAPYATALAAWLLDRRSRGTQENRIAAGTLTEGAGRWREALILSNDETRDLIDCLEAVRILRSGWQSLGVAGQKRLAARASFPQALAIICAEDRESFIAIQRRVAALAETGLAPERILTGDNLIRMGLEPGPAFSQILEQVYDAQLEGRIERLEQAEMLAKVLAGTPPQN